LRETSGIISRVKRGRRILLAVLGLAVLAVLVAALWPSEKEPEYQGKKLSEWLSFYMNASPAEQDAAGYAVRHIGTNALPILLHWMSYQVPNWRSKLVEVVQRMPISSPRKRALDNRMLGLNASRAAISEIGFEILREEAAPAVPALAGMVEDPNSRERRVRAMLALVSIGKDGMQPMVAAVTNKALPVQYRCMAAGYIADPNMYLGTNAISAARAIISCLEDPAVAVCIAQVLGILKFAPEEAVPALAKCLRSQDPDLRARAATALGEFGEDASSAVPDLLLIASDKDQTVRDTVTNALERIAPEVLKKDAH
jgi:HEAT repeat protein